MGFSNAELVEAYAEKDAVIASIRGLQAEAHALAERLRLARAVQKVTVVHGGVALAVDEIGAEEFLVCALGEDTWEAGRRALVFRDGRSAGGWSARLHFRPNARAAGGRPRDPGSFDFPGRDAALLAAKDWAASGAVPQAARMVSGRPRP